MKGIVVEINEKTAVMLTEDGMFSKTKNRNYEIGQTVVVTEWKIRGSRFTAGAAGLAAAIALCTIGSYAYYTPTDYVSMDVNPSISYTVNRFDRILDTKALNDDGEEILLELNLNNKKIDDALKETLDCLVTGGYLGENQDGDIMITTSNEKRIKAEEMAAELEQEVKVYLKDHGEIKGIVKSEAVETRRVQEAKKLGVSPGKLNLVDELQSSTSGAIDRTEWLSMPVKEINKEIKKNRKVLKEGVDSLENPGEPSLKNNPNTNDNEDRNNGNNLKSTWVNQEKDDGEKTKKNTQNLNPQRSNDKVQEKEKNQNDNWNNSKNRVESDENNGSEQQNEGGIDDKENNNNQRGSDKNSGNNNSSNGKNNGNGDD